MVIGRTGHLIYYRWCVMDYDDIRLIRHCERSEAIQGVLIRRWIASLRSQ